MNVIIMIKQFIKRNRKGRKKKELEKHYFTLTKNDFFEIGYSLDKIDTSLYTK